MQAVISQGDVKGSIQKSHKNLKELIAPSKISFRDSEERSQGERQYIGNVKNVENVENQLGVGSEHQVSTDVKF